jgi:hypothetical protein
VPVTTRETVPMKFNEALGIEIVDYWTLCQMTQDDPPTVAQLYERLGEAVVGAVANVESLARSTWDRCRSLRERKEGATWETITPEYRKAWIDGTVADLRGAGLALVGEERT